MDQLVVKMLSTMQTDQFLGFMLKQSISLFFTGFLENLSPPGLGFLALAEYEFLFRLITAHVISIFGKH